MSNEYLFDPCFRPPTISGESCAILLHTRRLPNLLGGGNWRRKGMSRVNSDGVVKQLRGKRSFCNYKETLKFAFKDSV